MKHVFSIGVFWIIRDSDNKILLVLRNDYDLWNLPWGALESNESPWDWVIREVKEETGLDVKVKKLNWVYSKVNEDEIVFSFECEITGWEIQLNEEAKDIKYFSFDDIPKNTSLKQIERIKDLLENDEEITLKIQTGKSSIDLIREWKI
jgi:ADP-ribose pyrophosphatase YjhB (NUDIX family)